MIKKKGWLSHDYLVFDPTKGAELDDTTRFLFLNKSGDWWSGDARIDVENYIRNDPERPKLGQMLWTAKFTDRPTFDQHLSWGHHRHERFFGFFDGCACQFLFVYDGARDRNRSDRPPTAFRSRLFTNSPAVLSSIRSPYGPFEASGHLNVSHTHARTDDSDEDDKYWRDQAGSQNCYNRFLVKWSVKTKAVITPAALSDGGRFGPPDAAACELHVFAKARVLCRRRHLGPHTNTARFGGGGAPRTPRSIHTRSRAHALFLSTSTDPPRARAPPPPRPPLHGAFTSLRAAAEGTATNWIRRRVTRNPDNGAREVHFTRAKASRRKVSSNKQTAHL